MLVRERAPNGVAKPYLQPSPGAQALCIMGEVAGPEVWAKAIRLPFGLPRREQARRVPASPTRGNLDSCRRPQGSRCLSPGPPCHARRKPPSALRVCVHPMFMPCLHARVSHACVSAKNANGRQRHLYNERACCSSGRRSASRSPCAGCTGSRVNADRQHACTCEQVSALLRWSRVDSDMLRSVGSGMLSMARGTWSLLSMDAKLHLRNSTCDH